MQEETGREGFNSIAYVYDGSLEGLLSAVFETYERCENPEDVVSDSRYQPRLGQDSLYVVTDFNKASRVRIGVVRKAGAETFRAIQRAALCEDAEVGTIVYRFIRYVMARDGSQKPNPVLDEISNPDVAAVVALEKHARFEAEKMRQFIRFEHLENGVWFAKCAPNASVIPLVMGHFSARFNDQPFIIYDERHHIAGVCNGFRWSLVSGDAINIPKTAPGEEEMQEMWKRFYDTLSIDARYNPELRRRFIPNRLRSNMTEFRPRKQ